MKDYTDDGELADGAGRGGFARIKSVISTAIGAIVAMSLLMALGIWFYRLGVRDAQNVPIIRAAVEPAKVRPDDPGGMEAPHQEIASFEANREEPASAAAVIIAPKPPAPKPEDVPLGVLAQAVPTPSEPERPSVETAALGSTATPPIRPEPTEPLPAPEAAETEVAMVAPAETAQETLTETPAVEEMPEPPEVKTGTEYAPPLSPVAPRRPPDLLKRTALAADNDERAAEDLLSRAAASKVQIQLAADPDEIAMRSKWERIRNANEDILRGRALAIQTTVSGGTTFYRLRVGPFESATEARNVCQALKARGQDCIVARNS